MMKAVVDYRPFGMLRFALAMSVVVSHSLGYSTAAHSFVYDMGLGNFAVMGFFVLSGYIITEAASTFYVRRPRAFILNRFWRIVPPYWAALAVSITIHYALVRYGLFRLSDPGTPTEAMFTVRNILANILAIIPQPGRLQLAVPGGFYGFVRFYWAVYIEAVFYLAVFVTMSVVKFSGLPRLVSYAVVLAVLLAHIINEYLRPGSLHWELPFAPYFILGACLYWSQRKINPAVIAAAAISYVLSLLHFARYVQGKVDLSVGLISGLSGPQIASVAVFAALPFVVVLLGSLEVSSAFRHADRALGDLTYPLYLNHFVMVVLFLSIGTNPDVIALAICFTSILLAAFMARAVEVPIKPLRDRLRGQDLSGMGTPHQNEVSAV